MVHRRLISLPVEVGENLPQSLYLLQVLQVVTSSRAFHKLLLALTEISLVVALIDLICGVRRHGNIVDVQSDVGSAPRTRHHRIYLG